MTMDLAEALAQGSIAAPDNGSTLDITLDVEFSAESQVTITSIVHIEKTAIDADESHPPDIQASNEMTQGFGEVIDIQKVVVQGADTTEPDNKNLEECSMNMDLAEDLDKNNHKENESNTLEITLDVEFSTEALESNEMTKVSFYKTNLKEFSAEALVPAVDTKTIGETAPCSYLIY